MNDLPAIWGEQPTALATVPERILHPNDHQRFMDTVYQLAQGSYWADIKAASGFTHAEMTILAAKSPVLREIYKTARQLGDEARQCMREDAADKRAIEGAEEEVYAANGNFAGMRRKYSDSLLVTQLKAGNPKRYQDVKVGLTGGVVLNVNLGLRRDPIDAIDVTPKEGEKEDEERAKSAQEVSV